MREPEPEYLVLQNLAVFQSFVVLWIGWSDVVSARTDQAVVFELFDDMGRTTTDTRHGEDRSKQVHINSERVIGGRGVEVHIGVQFLVRFDELLDGIREIEPL